MDNLGNDFGNHPSASFKAALHVAEHLNALENVTVETLPTHEGKHLTITCIVKHRRGYVEEHTFHDEPRGFVRWAVSAFKNQLGFVGWFEDIKSFFRTRNPDMNCLSDWVNWKEVEIEFGIKFIAIPGANEWENLGILVFHRYTEDLTNA